MIKRGTGNSMVIVRETGLGEVKEGKRGDKWWQKET